MSERAVVVRMAGIEKRFPGVRALRGVDLEVRAGEVHALMGENGAGKSTLMKILAGAERPDAGRIEQDGREVRIANPAEARRLGIAMIYQELCLVPHLSVAENVFLGREPVRGPLRLLDRARLRRDTAAILERLRIPIDPDRPVGELSVAARQMVEIARALSVDSRVLIMDEPTAPLNEPEVETLFRLIRALASRGVAVLYITHRLDEVQRVADRVTVLRDGERVGTSEAGALPRAELVRLMVGREITEEFPAREVRVEGEALEVRGLRRAGRLHGIDLTLRRGEVVGVAGLIGAGRTRLARTIFGAEPRDAGEVLVHGRPVVLRSPRDAIRAGIGFVPEDRQGEGLVPERAVRENLTLPHLTRERGLVGPFGWVRRRREAELAEGVARDLRIRADALEGPVKELSGGNQQKVLLARWLLSGARVLLVDEPTRGVDVGARVEIYRLLNRMAAEGVGILLFSSDLPEVLGMSDRVAVMREGRITGVLGRAEATPERVLHLAAAG